MLLSPNFRHLLERLAPLRGGLLLFLLGALAHPGFSFQAGIAVRPLRIPIGFPTAGYAQTRGGDDPGSPFAMKFPATRGLHTPITAKVLYLDNGKESLSLIRLDTVGIDLHMSQAFQKRVDKALGPRASSHTLILVGTHTHAGPGRLARNPVFWVAADTYSEWLFESLEDQIFAAWQEARTHLFPATIGTGSVDLGEIIHDRRCENPPEKDPTARLIVIEDARGVRAILINFGIHGTVLGNKNHYFSVDAPGLIERKVEEEYENPVTAFLIQGSAGDISPHSPRDFDNPWDRMEEIGQTAAEKIVPAVAAISTTSELTIQSLTRTFPLSRPLLGYRGKEFPYSYGAMLCGLGREHCDQDFKTPIADMKNCLLHGKRYRFPETELTAVRLNNFLILTLPGEPTTPLAKALRQELKAKKIQDPLYLFGYAQDHMGYLLLPWDWWQGGYEPSMSPWGPNLGEHLLQLSAGLATHLYFNSKAPEGVSKEQKRAVKEAHPPHPEEALEVGKGLAPPQKVQGSVTFSWYGGDALTDLPHVLVEVQGLENWEPLRSFVGQTLLDENHYSTFLDFSPDPNYWKARKTPSRHFKWTFTWRYRRPVPSPFLIRPGKYRLRIQGKAFSSGKISAYQLTSPPFTL